MHEKLLCYRELLELAGSLARVTQRWPRGYGYLLDQTRRAIVSAVLNLAEGNGKPVNTGERRRFFQISRASVAEVMACLDLALTFSLLPSANHQEWKEILRINYYRIGKLP